MLRDFSGPELALIVLPVLCLLAGGGLLAWENRPYQDLISQYSTQVSERSPLQRLNIRTAAKALDGAVIAPGETWSFNRTVGPRTQARGYAAANAFMEGALTRSVGGGICQVSSTLYAAVQETVLPIEERVAHFATVSSVPPGRDATVWYGKADLRFKNTFDRPIQIRAKADDLSLRVELWGSERPNQHAALRFSYAFWHGRRERIVSVYRRVNNRNTLLSQDVYRLH